MSVISKQQSLNPTLSLTSIIQLDMFMKAHAVGWNSLGRMLKSFSNTTAVLLQNEAILSQSAIESGFASFFCLMVWVHSSREHFYFRNSDMRLVGRNQMRQVIQHVCSGKDKNQEKTWRNSTRLYFCLFHSFLLLLLKEKISGRWKMPSNIFFSLWSGQKAKAKHSISSLINQTQLTIREIYGLQVCV